MDTAQQVLFVGGPLHGVQRPWENPPDYHPHVTASGMVPYAPRDGITVQGVDAIYAPIGMTHAAFVECLSQLAAG